MKNGLRQMNHEPTRHTPNHESTLLDLVLASNPDTVKDIHNFKPALSDHDGAGFKLTFKDVQPKPQFMTIRNFKNVTATNTQPRADTD